MAIMRVTEIHVLRKVFTKRGLTGDQKGEGWDYTDLENHLSYMDGQGFDLVNVEVQTFQVPATIKWYTLIWRDRPRKSVN